LLKTVSAGTSDPGVELVVDAKAEIGEGPSWDARKGVLYWVDIPKGQIHIYDAVHDIDRSISIRGYVSCVVPCMSDDDVIVTFQHGFCKLNTRTADFSLISEIEQNLPSNRFNDGKCDTRGRLWAGTMDMKEKEATGALYRLEGSRVKRMLSNVTISNGMGWSPDDATMYYIDTPSRMISTFDYDIDRGLIGRRRTPFDFSSQEGLPDGLAVDEEGMLWVAHWGGSKVSRWNPRIGHVVDQVIIPVPNVSSCCFGGTHTDELYVTTAREGLDSTLLSKYPSSGGLFRVRPGVKGLPTNCFGYR
jgi:sugar lactone lactonase YvrE